MPLLCISSPKGGVGKTTLAANVAWEFTRHGARVVVVDLDPQNSLGLHFGMDLRDAAGFMAGLRGTDNPRIAWRSAVRTGPAGVPYLPYGQVGVEAANAIGASVNERPDLLLAPLRDMLTNPGLTVVVDMPPGPSPLLSAMMPVADLIAVVLLVDAASLAQIPAIESGRAYGLGPGGVPQGRIGFILNQLDIRTRLGRASGDSAARHLGNRLLGVVYRDENVPEAIASQKMVGEYAPGSKAAQDIAALTTTIARRLTPDGSMSAPAGMPVMQEARL